ncbi:MAG: M3 family oligoendopeptidase [Anaerolineales bacterium]|nr:M3 family oligoendopeptidase [Anaerolineales bacterium]MCL4261456.1 M3 family oligoendopeptidase [Anaerolineales bacterium]
MAYKIKKWNLDELFTGFDSPELNGAFDNVEEQVTSFEGVRNKLKSDIDPETFLEVVRASEATSKIVNRIYAFAGLSFAEDTQNQNAQSLMGRVQQFAAEIQNRTLFFSLWWKDVDDANAERLMNASDAYRYYLEEMRHFKPHTLSEPEEKIVNLKDVTGSNALINLYDAITNRYVFKVKVNGKVQELTRAGLQPLIQGSDSKLRAAAYQELYRVYGEDGPILGQMYQTRARDWHNENINMRKFKSAMSVRNLANDVPDEAVNALLEVTKKNAKVFQRYFKMKAKHLGVSKLRRYDIYAPVAKSDKAFDFNAAANMVIESFSAFDPKIGELARRVFDKDHLDSEVRKGKQGGAFCASINPEDTPFVLMSYTGHARDVATLAHELGHAIHAMLASHHTTFTFHSSLPLAETASTFGEMMLTEKLLSEEKDESVRRDILFKQMDDAFATILRQIYFALFEREAHEMAQKNASVDELSAAYLANLKEQFGDAVEVSDDFKWEWVSIPHIYHTPFYVYAYAFGQLLVFALYEQYKAEGESFKPKYLKILSAGGSEAPAKILAEAGVNIRDAKFWQGGFDVLSRMVDELEKLPVEPKPKAKKATAKKKAVEAKPAKKKAKKR